MDHTRRNRLPTRRTAPAFVLATVVAAVWTLAVPPGARAIEPPPDCQQFDGRIFTDVPFDHPYCAWIEQLANHAISTGCAAGKYCPNDPVTRAQLAMLLERVMRGTDNWTSTPRIRFGCADPGSDCSESQGDPIGVNVFLDDPAYLGTEHLVRFWISASPTFTSVDSADSGLISYATFFPSPTAGVYERVMSSSNSMNVALTMNTTSTRYLMVEVGGRIFTSPPLTWVVGPT